MNWVVGLLKASYEGYTMSKRVGSRIKIYKANYNS
jgi:hypothetical protein